MAAAPSKKTPQIDKTPKAYVVRTFPIPPAEVWKQWTDAKELRRWFGVDENDKLVHCDFTPKTGAAWRLGVQPQDGSAPYYMSGVFREVKPLQWMVFTWSWEGERTWNAEPQKTPPPESVVIVQLKERQDGRATELFLWHNGLRDDKDVQEHQWGWGSAVTRLANLSL